MSAPLLTTDALVKRRGRAKQALIAHGFHIQSRLQELAETTRLRLDQLKDHQITEWEMVEGILQDLAQLDVQLGTTELISKWHQYELANFASSAVKEMTNGSAV